MSLTDKMAEVVEFCYSKGWSGPGSIPKTRGDCFALLSSEVAEALEAYRDCNSVTESWYSYTLIRAGYKFKELSAEQVKALSDLTPEELGLDPKPEGVGSELADVLIRWLDDCDRFNVNPDNAALTATSSQMMRDAETFGDQLDALQVTISFASDRMWDNGGRVHKTTFGRIFKDLMFICEKNDLNMEYEYERKMAHNNRREFRHGGKFL